MRDKIKRGCGNWVEGDKFWNREAEIRSMTEYLDDGANLLLIAQRRMGKTSLLRELGNRIGGEYLCLYVDLEACQSAPDAIVEISMAMKPHRDLWGKVYGVFQNVLAAIKDSIEEIGAAELKIKIRNGVDKGNWRAKGDRIFELMTEAGKPVVLFFDEVPILVNRILRDEDYCLNRDRIQEADIFMSWLRDNCHRHKGKIRMVITGSIGLEPILRQVGLSTTINHLQPFHLKAWDIETAIGCLQALGKEYSVRFESNVCKYMMEKLGYCIPHHVQMYFDYVYETCKKHNNMACTCEIADKVYDEYMLSTQGHVELSHYEERLRMVLGDEILTFALDILTETAKKGILTDDILRGYCVYYKDILTKGDGDQAGREVLGVLEHDGYLRRDGGGYVFNSKLLRDWWKAHHGQFFVSLEERGR
jgi:uncharacterized protein